MQMCIIHGHSDSGERTKTGLYHPNRALTVWEWIKLIARWFGYRQWEHTQIIGKRSHRASVYLPALTMFEITLPTQDTDNMDQALSYTTFVRLIIDSLVLEWTLSSSAKSQLQAHLSSNHNQSITRAQAANILSIALQWSQSLLNYLWHQQ